MLIKRIFDLLLSCGGLLVLSPLLVVMAAGAAVDTGSTGFFVQYRVGQHGVLFRIFKLRSMCPKNHSISRFGHFLRRSKIDELPQLLNVLLGDMSFVGPRPDITGYADVLPKRDQLLLTIKPGLTGLASLKYRQEEALLSTQVDALHYNDTIIWPDKVRLNNWYAAHRSFSMDLLILWYTFLPFLSFEVEAYVKEKGGF